MNRKIFKDVSFCTVYKDDIDIRLRKIQLNLMPFFAKDITSIDFPNILPIIRKMSSALL